MSGKLECKRKRVFSTCANKGNVFIFYVQRIEFLRLVKATVVVVFCVGSFLTSDHIPVYHWGQLSMLHDSRGKGLRSGHFSSETCKKKKLNIKGDAKLDPFPTLLKSRAESEILRIGKQLSWAIFQTGAKRIHFCKKKSWKLSSNLISCFFPARHE